MYGQEFYESQSEGSLRSAQEVVPVIMELINPRSVVDIGCGIGIWLSVYKNLGVGNILGMDGDYVSRDMLLIDSNEFIAHDFTKPINVDNKFYLVQSVEVAEHLRPEFAEQFVLSLTKLGSVVAFAATIPYQLGNGHVNEQFIDYWADIFEGLGYYTIDCIRPSIWSNSKVESWYKQNLMLFAQEGCIESHHWMKQGRKRTRQSQLSIVHPELYQLRVSMLVKVVVNTAHKLRAHQIVQLLMLCIILRCTMARK